MAYKPANNFVKTKNTKRRGKAKYNKLFIELWQCKGCAFEWAYKTERCPLCSSMETDKIL